MYIYTKLTFILLSLLQYNSEEVENEGELSFETREKHQKLIALDPKNTETRILDKAGVDGSNRFLIYSMNPIMDLYEQSLSDDVYDPSADGDLPTSSDTDAKLHELTLKLQEKEKKKVKRNISSKTTLSHENNWVGNIKDKDLASLIDELKSFHGERLRMQSRLKDDEEEEEHKIKLNKTKEKMDNQARLPSSSIQINGKESSIAEEVTMNFFESVKEVGADIVADETTSSKLTSLDSKPSTISSRNDILHLKSDFHNTFKSTVVEETEGTEFSTNDESQQELITPIKKNITALDVKLNNDNENDSETTGIAEETEEGTELYTDDDSQQEKISPNEKKILDANLKNKNQSDLETTFIAEQTEKGTELGTDDDSQQEKILPNEKNISTLDVNLKNDNQSDSETTNIARETEEDTELSTGDESQQEKISPNETNITTLNTDLNLRNENQSELETIDISEETERGTQLSTVDNSKLENLSPNNINGTVLDTDLHETNKNQSELETIDISEEIELDAPLSIDDDSEQEKILPNKSETTDTVEESDSDSLFSSLNDLLSSVHDLPNSDDRSQQDILPNIKTSTGSVIDFDLLSNNVNESEMTDIADAKHGTSDDDNATVEQNYSVWEKDIFKLERKDSKKEMDKETKLPKSSTPVPGSSSSKEGSIGISNVRSTANEDFVSGLDDFSKFMEHVEATDELDSAPESSMQEVLVEKGSQIVIKRIFKTFHKVLNITKKKMEQFCQFIDPKEDFRNSITHAFVFHKRILCVTRDFFEKAIQLFNGDESDDEIEIKKIQNLLQNEARVIENGAFQKLFSDEEFDKGDIDLDSIREKFVGNLNGKQNQTVK